MRIEDRSFILHGRKVSGKPMPIRFRCAYCNQLLGIARRKAGTVVRCPTCAGQVVVPTPEGEGTAQPPGGPKLALFERSDFDNLFEPLEPVPATDQPAVAASPAAPPAVPPAGNPNPAAWKTEVGGDVDVEPVRLPQGDYFVPPAPVAARPPGLVLSPMWSTVLSVVVILALALAFAAGLAVGYFWLASRSAG
jgi:hypothetical protein